MCFIIYKLFQFDCLNTLPDQILENVRVQLTIPEGYVTRAMMACPKLPYNELSTTFVIVEFPADITSSVGKCLFKRKEK